MERAGGIVKLMLIKLVHDLKLVGRQAMRMGAWACFAAKNRLLNKAGVSPMQVVTGRTVSVPASLLEPITNEKFQ